jgi:hypothetical protein
MSRALLKSLTRLEKPMESEKQEAVEEDEALKAIEEDAEPISDEEEIEFLLFHIVTLAVHGASVSLCQRTFRLVWLFELKASEKQEAVEEDEALKAIEEDAEPISDEEEIEESEDFEGSFELEEPYPSALHPLQLPLAFRSPLVSPGGSVAVRPV